MDFNAIFNTLVGRLSAQGVVIAEQDQVNYYLNVLEPQFPQWAERSRVLLRRDQWIANANTGFWRLLSTLTLLYFQEDLLAETRNPGTSSARTLAILQANWKRSREPKQGSGGGKGQ